MSNSCPGTTSAGTLTDLHTKGTSAKYITERPDVTFWRSRWDRHTKFALENVKASFHNQVSFGAECNLTLSRHGDLLHHMYLVIDLPPIKGVLPTDQQRAMNAYGFGATNFPACDSCDPANDGPLETLACNGVAPQPGIISSLPEEEPEFFDDAFDYCTGLARPWAHYTNSVGHVLSKKACFVAGGQQIQMLTSVFLHAYEELSGKAGKYLTEMIGKRMTRSQLVEDAAFPQRLYVPLPFYFTHSPGNAYPAVSTLFMPAEVRVCFEDLARCVQVSDLGTMVVKTTDCSPLNQQDLKAHIDSTYAFLDRPERERFASGCFDQLVHQVQYFHTCSQQCQLRVNLGFNHPVTELIWMVRRRANSMCNDHFNFSGMHGKDPIKSVYLKLNGSPRFAPMEGRYFRLVQPYQHHSRIPGSFVYSYSFALNPEDETQPSGSINMSLIDNAELNIELQDGLSSENIDFFCMARSINVAYVNGSVLLMRLI